MRTIEEDKQFWKAKQDDFSCIGPKHRYYEAKGILRGIDLAQSKSKKPCNQVVTTSSKPCEHCFNWKTASIGSHCPDCGRALNR